MIYRSKMFAGLAVTAFLYLLLIAPVRAGDHASYNMEKAHSISYGGIGSFYLVAPENISGTVTIRPVSGDKARADIGYRGTAESESAFKWLVDLIDIETSTANGTGILKISTPENAPWEELDKSMAMDISMNAPETLKISIQGRFHSIDVAGPFRQLDIDNDFGEVKAAGIRGEVNISTSLKKVFLSDIRGRVNVFSNNGPIEARDIVCGGSRCRFETTQGEIDLRDITGEVEAITTYKDILMSEIDAKGGLITATNNYGRIKLRDITGVVDITADYNVIKGNDIHLMPGFSRITNSYEDIDLKDVMLDGCDLAINNSFADVLVVLNEETSTNLLLSTAEGGTIEARGVPIRPTSISRNRFTGVIGSGTSNLEINIEGIGKIEIAGYE
jgi:hypothetical protein